MADSIRRLRLDEWQAEGLARFGPNVAMWKFRCPSCGQVQSAMDFRSYGVPLRNIDVRVGFSCIGATLRQRGFDVPVVEFCEPSRGYGCVYDGAGIFRIAPLEVVFGIARETGNEAVRPMFGWAE